MYIDRTDAGRALAAVAALFDAADPLVLCIPRGGVIVGRTLAESLHAEIDVVMAKKIGAPFNPEFAIAAVDADGEVLTAEGSQWDSLRAFVMEQAQVQKRELLAGLRRFRGGREPKTVAGRTVFLVDDGLATGLTAMAAIRYVRRHKPKQIILAVPVAPAETLDALRPLVDEVICPLSPRVFHAVGEWYVAFEQVDDQDVVRALEEFEDAR
ncbi:MAG: phosphoribosyltransferase family protein [Bacillota bacterium]